jgi:hypothetical protein
MYYDHCVLSKVHVRNLGELGMASYIGTMARMLGTFHNIMVFMICRMGMWILKNG